jgi:succinate dehydrogenase hydrophobic anchor subunit
LRDLFGLLFFTSVGMLLDPAFLVANLGLVLLVGVLVFLFYLFQAPPLLYNPAHERQVREAAPVWSVFGLLLVLVALISSRNGR